jgi:hypothetical protein
VRLTIALLGWSFDLSMEPTASDDDPQRDLGTTGHYPVGFVARHDVPEEVSYPQRTPAWDDEDRRR